MAHGAHTIHTFIGPEELHCGGETKNVESRRLLEVEGKRGPVVYSHRSGQGLPLSQSPQPADPLLCLWAQNTNMRATVSLPANCIVVIV